MTLTRFALGAALLAAACGPALAQQTCPIPPELECISLAMGQVHEQTWQPGETLCVDSGAGDTEYTLLPINYSYSDTVSFSVLGQGIQAVSGPPSPRPAADAAGLALAPLAPPSIDSGKSGSTGLSEHELEVRALLAPEMRATTLIDSSRRSGQKFGSTPPVVDQLIDIQVALGCTGTPDIRKGRVEAVSTPPPGLPRLYFVQEVHDPQDDGTFEPVLPGGFARLDFEALASAFDLAPAVTSTDLTMVNGSSTLSYFRLGASQLLAQNYGAATDVDGNGGIVVFYTRRMNEASPPASSAVTHARFLERDLMDPVACPLSNGGEIVYMLMPDPTGVVNSNVRTLSFVAGSTQRTFLAEYARLINAGRRLYVTAAPLEETWLDITLSNFTSELFFFATSVGLTPDMNINLSNLTTGPVASKRVAAFNSFVNLSFGEMRSWFLQIASTFPGSLGLLADAPQPNTTLPPGELYVDRVRGYYGGTVHFLRYALDRRNGDDAAGLRALVDSPLTGTANLSSVFGADIRDWAHDFGTAFYLDDAVAGASAPHVLPSWNYRSVYGGLGGFPIGVRPLVNNVALSIPLTQDGAQRWMRFGVPAGALEPARVTLTVNGSSPMTPMRVSLVRTK